MSKFRKNRGKNIEYDAYKFEPTYLIKIKDLSKEDYRVLAQNEVEVEGLKEKVYFSINGQSDEVIAIGLETDTYYKIASFEKVTLTVYDFGFFKWKLGKKIPQMERK